MKNYNESGLENLTKEESRNIFGGGNWLENFIQRVYDKAKEVMTEANNLYGTISS
jgi:hypothetical protein